jgi:hypothetical protein
MDIDKAIIIKKLGNGMAGTVYLVNIRKKMYALKIEKIADKFIHKKDMKKDVTSREWREIDFSLNFANEYPDQFITLYKYDIIKDCKHVQEFTNNLKTFPIYVQNIFTEKNNSNYCIRKVFSLIDNILKDVIDTFTIPQFYSMMAQVTYIIHLMRENGYTHNDLHSSNIGVVKTNKKYLTILNNKIPLLGYQYKAIDYGMVLNKKYKMDKVEKEMFNDSNINEINRLLKKVVTFEKNDKIKKLFTSEKEGNWFNKFMKSDDYFLVKDYGVNNEDRFLIYQILFPDNAQKMFFGKEYSITYKPIMRINLVDILYFFNNKLNLPNIIKYCAIRLKQ